MPELSKKNEEQLNSALAELTAIYENTPITMVLLDRNRRILKANAFAAAFSRRSVEEMIGLRGGEALRCLHHMDSHDGCGYGSFCSACNIRKVVLETFETRSNRAEIEAWLPVDKAGSTEDRCLLINTSYIQLKNSERVLFCAQDITARKRIEKALQESEAKFHMAFDSSPDSVNINRMDGTYIEINQGFTRFTGYTRDDVIGKTSTEIDIWCIPADRQTLVKGLQEVGYYENLESTFRRKDGSTTTALMSAGIVLINNEPHILSITRDIHERIMAENTRLDLEKQLQQAQKMESVGRLTGGVAHDLNNMLGPILGYGEMLMEDLSKNDPRHDAAEQIMNAAVRAKAIVRQLLAFSRKQTLETKYIDLNELINDFEKLLKRTLREDISVQLDLADALPPIQADIGLLEQVIMNLSVNAQDAMPEGGALVFRTQPVALEQQYVGVGSEVIPGRYVMLSVTDSGSGMDSETKKKIFEPFFTTKEKYHGTGLGLSTAYGIIKQHTGYIWVDSEPGKGTMFTICFPVADVADTPPKQRADHDGAATGSETILLVENEQPLREMTKSLLTRNGYTVLAAANGAEAVEICKEYDGVIHLLLTDVILPGIDGRKIAASVSAQFPGIKVLYMSGYPDDVISHRGILNTETAFVQKPFTVKTILNKIRECLNQKKIYD